MQNIHCLILITEFISVLRAKICKCDTFALRIALAIWKMGDSLKSKENSHSLLLRHWHQDKHYLQHSGFYSLSKGLQSIYWTYAAYQYIHTHTAHRINKLFVRLGKTFRLPLLNVLGVLLFIYFIRVHSFFSWARFDFSIVHYIFCARFCAGSFS